MQEDLTPRQQRIALHIRIWFTAVIAGVVFIGMNWFLSRDNYDLQTGLVEGLIFFIVWVVVHYIIYRKQFKSLQDSNE